MSCVLIAIETIIITIKKSLKGDNMISKKIIVNTIEALEDMLDYIDLENKPELRERMGEIQTLLNFWRVYKEFYVETSQKVKKDFTED